MQLTVDRPYDHRILVSLRLFAHLARTARKASDLIEARRRVVVLRADRMSNMRLRIVDLLRRVGDVGVLGDIGARRHERRARRHRDSLPPLSAPDEELLDTLYHEGAATRAVRIEGAARHEITAAMQRLQATDPAEPVCHLPLDQSNGIAALYRWGLREDNLDIAERVIGGPVRYVGLEMKVERVRAAGIGHQARRWHVDAEDRRMLKIIVYLDEVDSGNGPFEYLPAPVSAAARRTLRCRPGITFLPDDTVVRVAPADAWTQLAGPAGTAVYADTGRVLHRLKAPTDRDRHSVTFVYTSDRPFAVFARFMPPRALVDDVAATSTPRQRRALPDREWLRHQRGTEPPVDPDRRSLSRSAS